MGGMNAQPTQTQPDLPSGPSRAFIAGAVLLGVLAVCLLAGLLYFISSSAQPKDNDDATDDLNAAAAEAGFPAVHFHSQDLGSESTHDATANLGETTREEFINTFRYLNQVTSDQLEKERILWRGGVSGDIDGANIYLDSSLNPVYVDSALRTLDIPFERLSKAQGVTSIRAGDCVNLVDNPAEYDSCTEAVVSAVRELFASLPAESKQHGEVFLQLVRASDDTQSELIHIENQPAELPTPDQTAQDIGVLARTFFDVYRLPDVRRVSMDAIQLGNTSPRVHVFFNSREGNCDLTQNQGSIEEANAIIARADDESELRLRLQPHCAN